MLQGNFKNKTAALFAVVFVITIAFTVTSSALRQNVDSFVLPDTTVVETASSRYAMAENSDISVPALLNEDGYVKMMENSRLEIWYREEICAIRIRDKISNYMWGSIDADKGESLNQKWSAMANSVCTFEYYDAAYNEIKISLSESKVKKQFTWSDNVLKCAVNNSSAGISFEFTMTLNSDSLSFGIDDASIKESRDCLLKCVYFMPFLGCVKENAIDGYMFVPDGCGALIRFSKSSDYISTYTQKVYGLDMGIDQMSETNDLLSTRTNDYAVDTAQATFPVYGVVHGAGCNAVMSVIENGCEFTNIIATPAGVTTDYNWVTARFDYRQSYTHPVGKSGSGIYCPQKLINTVNPKLTLYFLTGDDAAYSGMAVRYRNLLKQNNKLSTERTDTDIPFYLNIAGSDVKQEFIFNSTRTFTSVSQTNEILKVLANNGMSNITLGYQGWQRGGVNGSKYGTIKFQNSVGSLSDFTGLKELLEQLGGRLYLNMNVVNANDDQINTVKYSSVTLSKQYAKLVRSNSNIMYNTYYMIKPGKVCDAISAAFNGLNGFGINFGQLGSRLYADYTSDKYVLRNETSQMFKAALSAGSGNIGLENPNEYLWKYTNDYFSIPVSNSRYLYETDTVPFLQIVLKGHVDYYAPYANQGFYTQNSILKMIEYGTYPSFIVMAADNRSLNDTPLEEYFSLNFDDWYPTIQNVYNGVNAALKNTEGMEIIEHTVLQHGIVRVSYSGGVNIYVNYTSEAYNADGITVPATGYYVER